MKTRAAILWESNKPVVVEEIELDPPRAGEVLVRMAVTGVCHSDLSAVRGLIRYDEPTVLGHEGAGTVVEVGQGVTTVTPGDRVMLAFVQPCGRCYQCTRGRSNICERHVKTPRGALFDGTRRFHKDSVRFMQYSRVGAMSEFTVVSADGVVPVRPDASIQQAALVSCCVMTGIGAVRNTAAVELGSTVAVIGVGGTGINVVQGAVLAGASQVIAIDLSEDRLRWATEFGATHTLNSTECDPIERVLGLTAGSGVDYAFEAIGKPETITQAFRMLRGGGTAVVIGLTGADETASIPAQMLTGGERRLIGCMYGSSRIQTDMPRLLQLAQAGRLRLEELVSRTWKLDQINEAFAELESGHGLRSVISFED